MTTDRAHEMRAILWDVVEGLKGEDVALLLSGGVDSNALMLACLHQMVKPSCYTFRLDGVVSTDFSHASHNAHLMGLRWRPVVLPADRDTVVADIRTLIAAGGPRKTTVECTWCLWHALRQIPERHVIIGLNADSYFGLSQNIVRRKDDLDALDSYRRAKLNGPHPQIELLGKLLPEKVVVAPFRDRRMLGVFLGATWNEVNRPRQKQTIRDAFPELDMLRTEMHTNFQCGDSGIREMFARLVDDDELNPGRRFKSVTGVYNAIWRRTAA